MKTFYTNNKNSWFTDQEKDIIKEQGTKSFGCKIFNLDITGLERSIFASGYPMDTYNYDMDNIFNSITSEIKVMDIDDNYITFKHPTIEQPIKRSRKTLSRLASCEIASGHDAFLKGITVQFSLNYPVWLSPQIQRYSHIFYVSSTSAMQRITSIKDISYNLDPLVANTLEAKLMQDRINIYNALINIPNNDNFYIYERITATDIPKYEIISKDMIRPAEVRVFTKEEFYHYIISICPQGLMKTVEITTNALQLKNVINQRTFHKMPEWRYITTVFKSLPIWKDLKVTFNKNKLVPIEEQK